ncbi:MAG: acetolactate synthase small subunit [Intestinibacter sp.]|uniref:acetolactate synthase small subunit n=1 Tax=Intestinibacter sp. TaxID=1965304 RepID=UPI003F15CA68
MMKKRWIALYVENYSGVLAKISSLFSAKLYNLDTLTVGKTEDPETSRMTIGVYCDDVTFEQIKKQLNRFVEVIKVIDLTTLETHTKELLFIKVKNCSTQDKNDIFQMAKVFDMDIVDIGKKSIILQCVHTEKKVDRLIEVFAKQYPNNIVVVRSGSVAIESINIEDR